MVTYLFEVAVTVDELALVWVLQLVCLDVLPESVDDDRPCLSVHAQQARQPRVQLKLGRLQHIYMWPDVWLLVKMLKWRYLVKWRQNNASNYYGF